MDVSGENTGLICLVSLEIILNSEKEEEEEEMIMIMMILGFSLILNAYFKPEKNDSPKPKTTEFKQFA